MMYFKLPALGFWRKRPQVEDLESLFDLPLTGSGEHANAGMERVLATSASGELREKPFREIRPGAEGKFRSSRQSLSLTEQAEMDTQVADGKGGQIFFQPGRAAENSFPQQTMETGEIPSRFGNGGMDLFFPQGALGSGPRERKTFMQKLFSFGKRGENERQVETAASGGEIFSNTAGGEGSSGTHSMRQWPVYIPEKSGKTGIISSILETPRQLLRLTKNGNMNILSTPNGENFPGAEKMGKSENIRQAVNFPDSAAEVKKTSNIPTLILEERSRLPAKKNSQALMTEGIKVEQREMEDKNFAQGELQTRTSNMQKEKNFYDFHGDKNFPVNTGQDMVPAPVSLEEMQQGNEAADFSQKEAEKTYFVRGAEKIKNVFEKIFSGIGGGRKSGKKSSYKGSAGEILTSFGYEKNGQMRGGENSVFSREAEKRIPENGKNTSENFPSGEENFSFSPEIFSSASIGTEEKGMYFPLRREEPDPAFFPGNGFSGAVPEAMDSLAVKRKKAISSAQKAANFGSDTNGILRELVACSHSQLRCLRKNNTVLKSSTNNNYFS